MKQLYLFMMLSIFVGIHYVYGAADTSTALGRREGVVQQIVADRYPSLYAMDRLRRAFRTAEDYFWYVKDSRLLNQINDELTQLLQSGHLLPELKPYVQDFLSLMNEFPVDDSVVYDQIADEFQVLLNNYSEKQDELSQHVNRDMIVGIEKEKINKGPKEWIIEIVEILNVSDLWRLFVGAPNSGVIMGEEIRNAFVDLFSNAVQVAHLSEDQNAVVRRLLNAVTNQDGNFDWGSYYQQFKGLFVPVKEQLAEEKVFVEEKVQVAVDGSVSQTVMQDVVKSEAPVLSRRAQILQAERARLAGRQQTVQPRVAQQTTQVTPAAQPVRASVKVSQPAVKAVAPAPSRQAQILEAQRAWRSGQQRR